MIAAFTVGGKSLGKKIAMDNSQAIIYFVARIFLSFSENRAPANGKTILPFVFLYGAFFHTVP